MIDFWNEPKKIETSANENKNEIQIYCFPTTPPTRSDSFNSKSHGNVNISNKKKRIIYRLYPNSYHDI